MIRSDIQNYSEKKDNYLQNIGYQIEVKNIEVDLDKKEREYHNQEDAGEMFAAGGGDFSVNFTSN